MVAFLEIKRWSIFMYSLLEEFTVTFLLSQAFLIPLMLSFSGTKELKAIGSSLPPPSMQKMETYSKEGLHAKTDFKMKLELK